MAETWLLISILAVLIILGIIAFFVLKSKKKKFQPDYYTLFILGLVFFVIGIAAEIPVMWILGIIFFILGITNKDKWKRKKNLGNNEQKTKKAFYNPYDSFRSSSDYRNCSSSFN